MTPDPSDGEGVEMDTVICCYIYPFSGECRNAAGFTLQFSRDPSDCTEACSLHIDELMGDKGQVTLLRI